MKNQQKNRKIREKNHQKSPKHIETLDRFFVSNLFAKIKIEVMEKHY